MASYVAAVELNVPDPVHREDVTTYPVGSTIDFDESFDHVKADVEGLLEHGMLVTHEEWERRQAVRAKQEAAYRKALEDEAARLAAENAPAEPPAETEEPPAPVTRKVSTPTSRKDG